MTVLFTKQVSNINILPKMKPRNTKAWRIFLNQYLKSNKLFADKLLELNKGEEPINNPVALSFVVHHSNRKGTLQGYIDVIADGLFTANVIKDRAQITPLLDNCRLIKDNQDRVCITLREI